MSNIHQEPTYYPIPYELGIKCPTKRCRRDSPNYCYNPLATQWTMTDSKEQYHYIDEKRRVLSTKYLPEHPAYYRLKTDSLADRKYLIGRYYPIKHMVVEEGTGKMYPRDHYTFHGFLYTPEDYTNKLTGVVNGTNVESGNIQSLDNLDFNF